MKDTKKKINKIKYLSISNTPNYASSNYWLNILEIKKNLTKGRISKIIKYFFKNNIEVRPLWHPNHLQKEYKNFETYRLDKTKHIYKNRLCLPSSPQLTLKQLNFICEKIKFFF